jgi:beta-galactosidase
MKTSVVCLLLGGLLASAADKPPLETVLYGASYYHEYMPVERLDKDVEMMKKAGITVVRVGESTWSSWEPQDGKFEYQWIDRVLDAMHKAGIKVIVGTPTYSIPPWLFKKHPDILIAHSGSAPPLGDPFFPTYPPSHTPGAYGIRQNHDLMHPEYIKYAERVIRQSIAHVKDHPAVIGFQVDNETGPNAFPTPHSKARFLEHMKEKYGTPQEINRRWGLTYWGQLVQSWDEFPSREGILNPGYKLEWERFHRRMVTDFLGWQAKIIREMKRPEQFIMHDFVGGVRMNIDQFAIAEQLDIVAANPYHAMQDRFDGLQIAITGDLNRSLKQASYLVTETNAQAIGWDSRAQFPPYDGQLRLAALANAASGANMIAYWHWHSLHYGQETYWRGVLSHDLEENRAYREVSKIGAELKRLGPQLANLKKDNKVAILLSLDSDAGIRFMPVSDQVKYETVLHQMYGSLFALNVEADFVTPSVKDWSKYKVLLVPPLYVADDATLKRIADYVKAGGHVVMSFKSGFANEDSTVRWARQPGPLREAAGFTYQEFSNLGAPVKLKPDVFGLEAANTASVWAEFLMTEGAQTVMAYDHPFFGQWPAVTRNKFGAGTLTYEGTFLSDAVQRELVRDALRRAGLTGPDQLTPQPVKVRHGKNAQNRLIHYYLNFSGTTQTVTYPYGGGDELLAGKAVAKGDKLTLGAWDVAIVAER